MGSSAHNDSALCFLPTEEAVSGCLPFWFALHTYHFDLEYTPDKAVRSESTQEHIFMCLLLCQDTSLGPCLAAQYYVRSRYSRCYMFDKGPGELFSFSSFTPTTKGPYITPLFEYFCDGE